jgi:hypothetical protein
MRDVCVCSVCLRVYVYSCVYLRSTEIQFVYVNNKENNGVALSTWFTIWSGAADVILAVA